MHPKTPSHEYYFYIRKIMFWSIIFQLFIELSFSRTDFDLTAFNEFEKLVFNFELKFEIFGEF